MGGSVEATKGVRHSHIVPQNKEYIAITTKPICLKLIRRIMEVIKGAREYDLTHACTTKEKYIAKEVYSHYDHTNLALAHGRDYGNYQRCT